MATYVWNGATSDWFTPSNWLVAGKIPSSPPGSSDTVQITSNGSLLTVSGGGAQSAALNITGPVYLDGSFSTASLNVSGSLQVLGTVADAGTASFANGASLQGGVVSVQQQATFGASFTLNGAELDLAYAYPASISTLTLQGAATLGGAWTITTLDDSKSTSLTLGAGSFTVTNAPPKLQSLIIAGPQTLVGTFTTGGLTVLGGATLTLNQGDSLTADTATFQSSGNVNLNAGTLTVRGDASFGSSLTLSGAGTFAVGGTLSTLNGSISASNSSRAEIANLDGTSGGLTLTSDATSAIEIGGQNVGAAGSITIDAGVSFTESGTFTAPIIADNGSITVAPDTSLSLSSSGSRGLTGTGSINIEGGSSLTLNGVDTGASDSVKISFDKPGGQLWLTSNDFDALGNFVPEITGFGPTDAIEYGGVVTSASYSGNYLSLYNGASLVAQLNIGHGPGSGYSTAAGAFSVVPVQGGYSTQIDYVGGGTNPAPGGTTTGPGHSFVWTGAVAGNWNDIGSWSDTTSGLAASYAPGASDIVTVNAAANQAAQVLVGDGDAYGLTLKGETLLVGTFKVEGTGANGGLTVAQSASAYLNSGSSLTVAGSATFGSYTGLTLDGGSFAVTGTFYGGADIYGITNNANYVIENAGASFSAGSLVDSSSSYSVGAGDQLTVLGNVSDASAYTRSAFAANGGTITVGGTFVSGGDQVSATNGGQIKLTALQEDTSGEGVYLTADASSSIEIGGQNVGTAGAITIDSGVTVTEQGSLTAPTIVDKGALKVGAGQYLSSTGTLEVDGGAEIGANATLYQSGAITGAGSVTIDAGAQLTVTNAAASASSATIAFNGAGGQLTIDSSDLNGSKVFAPSISGFGPSNVIDVSGATVTSASYSGGALTLLNGGSIVGTLDLSGNYLGSTFSVSNNQITVSPGGNAAPVIVAPASVSSIFSIPVAVSGVAVFEATAVATITVSLSVSNGVLIAGKGGVGGGGTVAGSGTNVLTISGSATEVDADLATLHYEATSLAGDTIAVSASNGIGGTANQTIAVSATTLGAGTTVPTQTFGGPYSGNENATIALTGLSVSASPNGSDPLTTMLSVSDGTISVGGQTGASVTLTGTAATIDAELSAGVTYTPNANFQGSDALSLLTTDTADALSAIGSASIAVNPPVQSGVSVSYFLAHQAALDALGPITIADSWTNVSAALTKLNADAKVASIVLTDATAPVMTLSVSQALANTRALGALSSGSPTWSLASDPVVISDTTAQVNALTGSKRLALAAVNVTSANGYTSGVLTETESWNNSGSYDIHYYKGGAFSGVAYASYDNAYTSSGFRDQETFYDASGNVVAFETFQANGGYAITLTGVLWQQKTVNADGSYDIHYYKVGAFSGVAYASYDNAYTSSGFRDQETFYDASGNVVAFETFQSNSGYAIALNGSLSQQKTVNADGSYDVAFTNVTGQSYGSYENIYSDSGVRVGESMDYLSGAGTLSLYGNGLTVTAGSSQLSVQLPAAGGGDVFALNGHGQETITASTGTSGETFVFAPGFGQDTLNGFVGTGANNDVLQFSVADFSYLSGTDTATDLAALIAHGAITQSGTSTLITDTHGDALKLAGVSAATLEAHSTNFAFK